MRDQTRTNLTLLTIAVLLGLLVWWSQPSPPQPLSQLVPQEITSIEINNGSGEPILLRLTDNQWLIGDRPADSGRIEQLLKISETPSLHRFAAPRDLQPYGLAPAHLTLRLNQELFAFGVNDPVNGWRYVLHRDEIHLIGDGFHHHLTAPSKTWMETPDA